MKKKIIAIVGSYRKGRTIDSAVDELLNSAKAAGATTEKINLLDKHIEFCTNCRNCVQQIGAQRGECTINDDMKDILDKIDAADSIVLAAPVNWFNITAIMKRFIERLMPYGYWPWGKALPKNRIKKLSKKAVVITSSGAPAIIGRIMFRNAPFTLKTAANCFGAKVVKKIFIGLSAMEQNQPLPEKYKSQLRTAGALLAN